MAWPQEQLASISQPWDLCWSLKPGLVLSLPSWSYCSLQPLPLNVDAVLKLKHLFLVLRTSDSRGSSYIGTFELLNRIWPSKLFPVPRPLYKFGPLPISLSSFIQCWIHSHLSARLLLLKYSRTYSTSWCDQDHHWMFLYIMHARKKLLWMPLSLNSFVSGKAKGSRYSKCLKIKIADEKRNSRFHFKNKCNKAIRKLKKKHAHIFPFQRFRCKYKIF